MYLIRDVFTAKPGKAKQLVKMFKQVEPFLESQGFHNPKVMTDYVAKFWTVVLHSEVETLSAFENHTGFSSNPEVAEIMKDYMNLIESGYREIFKIE